MMQVILKQTIKNKTMKKKDVKTKTFTSTINIRARQDPYICPVCGGNGLVANGFYNQIGGEWSTTSITPEQCRSCNGTGIVWG